MDEHIARKDFRKRRTALLKWCRDAAIITSGGWAALGFTLWFAPISKLASEVPYALGVCIGALFLLGCAISAAAWWLVTGRNPGDRLLGFEGLR